VELLSEPDFMFCMDENNRQQAVSKRKSVVLFADVFVAEEHISVLGLQTPGNKKLASLKFLRLSKIVNS
jgi:hypothetical protein